MSSRLRPVLAAFAIWAVWCHTFAQAQAPDSAFMPQQRAVRRQSDPAVQPEMDDGWPLYISRAPVGRSTAMATANLNFADDPIDGTTYAPQDGDGGWAPGYAGGPSFQGPYDDNGWADCACSQNGGYNGCGGGCCGGCNRGPIYARAEYLAWWVKGDNTPALVTTSVPGTAIGVAGQLGQPGTSVLFGGDGINSTMRSGVRTVLGWWINPSARIEGEFFGLGTATTNYNQSSTGDPILARPFYNLQTAMHDANVIAFPAQAQGSVQVMERSSFLGAGIHATQNLRSTYSDPDRQHRVDFIYGFRYLRLAENLTVNDSMTSIVIPPGTVFTASDGFRTTNNFYGANVGLMSEAPRRDGA